ncbi:MAG TPA: OB-fold nucleic acid binding domain-containing protein, partial [Pyrinomonadaceae bacterium]|nr:OB-fold nucleic acid binding domain-containing protein [Pyrinomonadaceae bacterium]
MSIPFIEDNDQTVARREHLAALRELVGNTYPNRFERSEIVEPGKEDTITGIVEKFRDFQPKEELKEHVIRTAGRLASPPRAMGKTAFVHLSDGVSRLQIYVRRDDVKGVSNDADGGEVEGWPIFQLLDHGDFIGVEGYLFVTKTGELSVHV